jgi:hypothetical protein
MRHLLVLQDFLYIIEDDTLALLAASQPLLHKDRSNPTD